nr:FAD-dependent isoamyl alcohol oxidase [Trichoderma calamagrostidis]
MPVKSLVLFGLVCMAMGQTINTSQACRVLPEDAAWPSAQNWATLNQTINGHLIATIPEASVCHTSPYEDYNATACALLQNSWDVAVLSHYLGKSTGRGSLSLWTHNLKSTEYIPSYNSSYYRGPAAKLGAGVQGWEAYGLANSTGHRIVGGSCPTVGIVGGYSQGGGHSILSSSYGLGTDNVLEWEVVTVEDGRHLIATPTQNADLYWALSGGGGGTFAVVLSMTARLHVDGIVGGTVFSFNDSAVGNDAYWEAVGAFHALLPAFLDTGNSFTYSIGKNSLTAYGTMPGANLADIDYLLEPFLADLKHRNITPSNSPQVSPNYYTHFYTYLGPVPYGSDTYNPFTNSRVVPRSLITNATSNAIVTDLFRNISQVEAFSPFYCDSFNVSTQQHPENSLHPAWRDGMILCSPAGSWDWSATPDEMAARDEYAAKTLQPLMDEATPGGLVYLNEANHMYENWKENFFGDNYEKLLSVKMKYDPEEVFEDDEQLVLKPMQLTVESIVQAFVLRTSLL